MKDDHKEKLKNRLTPMDLFRLTPKTNCGECGFMTCLAFATQVVTGQGDLASCPYLGQEAVAPLREKLAEQHDSGIGLKQEGFEKALSFLRIQLERCDFQKIAPSIGAQYLGEEEMPRLKLPYFRENIMVSKESVSNAAGEELNPWEKIFIYNYIIGGAVEPSEVWVGMESLPNSVSKIKTLKAHCEDRLAEAFKGKMEKLPVAVSGLGKEITGEMEQVDFAAEFQILPKLIIRVIWWDEDEEEGFPAKVKFLFNDRVLHTLDLESLIFACEQLADRLLEGS